MAAYVFGLFLLGLYMFISRVRSIKSGEVSIKYFCLYEGAPPSPKVQVIGQHFDNHFQVPMLFLLTGCIFLSLKLVSAAAVALAWIFVFSRAAHTYVHLGSNDVKLRAATYFIGWFVIVAMWAQLLWATRP